MLRLRALVRLGGVLQPWAWKAAVVLQVRYGDAREEIMSEPYDTGRHPLNTALDRLRTIVLRGEHDEGRAARRRA